MQYSKKLWWRIMCLAQTYFWLKKTCTWEVMDLWRGTKLLQRSGGSKFWRLDHRPTPVHHRGKNIQAIGWCFWRKCEARIMDSAVTLLYLVLSINRICSVHWFVGFLPPAASSRRTMSEYPFLFALLSAGRTRSSSNFKLTPVGHKVLSFHFFAQ